MACAGEAARPVATAAAIRAALIVMATPLVENSKRRAAS
jgi:hypothetical protein